MRTGYRESKKSQRKRRKKPKPKGEELPQFLKSLKARLVTPKLKKLPKCVEFYGFLFLGSDFFGISNGKWTTQIYDLKTKKPLRRAKLQPTHNNFGRIVSTVLAEKMIYCFTETAGIYYSSIEEEDGFRKLNWVVEQSEREAARTLCGGFGGKGIVNGSRGTIYIGHLKRGGGIRFTTILGARERERRYQWENWVVRQLVTGEKQNQVVMLYSSSIQIHQYSFSNRKLMRSITCTIPGSGKNILQEYPELIDSLTCKEDGTSYIAVSFARSARRLHGRGMAEKATKIILFELTVAGLIEVVSTCKLEIRDMTPLLGLKFFGESFGEGRYLMLAGYLWTQDRNHLAVFFCFDKLEKKLRLVESLQTVLKDEVVRGGLRLFGKIYSVNSSGKFVGLTLESK